MGYLDPPFNPMQTKYDLILTGEGQRVTLTPALTEAAASGSIHVNGHPLKSGATSQELHLEYTWCESLFARCVAMCETWSVRTWTHRSIQGPELCDHTLRSGKPRLTDTGDCRDDEGIARTQVSHEQLGEPSEPDPNRGDVGVEAHHCHLPDRSVVSVAFTASAATATPTPSSPASTPTTPTAAPASEPTTAPGAPARPQPTVRPAHHTPATAA